VRHVVQSVRLIACGALVVGCGSDEPFRSSPPFDDVEDVKTWALSASAVGVYAHAYEVIAYVDGEVTFPDAACPARSDDGTTLTLTGGCTDGSKRRWEGRATVVRDGDDLSLTYSSFEEKDGTVLLRRTGTTSREFDANLVIGEVTTIEYSGTVEGSYAGPSTWNGSGRVARKGPIAPTGGVDATTVDELVDDATCSGQPVSGSTTLEARGDTAVITYDGATDCDGEQNARLVVNGKDRGVVAGISCSFGTKRADGGSALWSVLALAGFALVRWRGRAGAKGVKRERNA
jgi:hypothetical protein